MLINQEVRDRITAVANQLFHDSGRTDFPTVDVVRRASKTNMNDASAVMKDWRRMQTATAEPLAQTVPERVQQASAAAMAAMWHEAQEISNENLKNVQAAWDIERAEADVLRNELSTAFENQAVELMAATEALDALDKAATAAAQEATTKLDKVLAGLAAMTERASTAEARVVEIEKRADDLKSALSASADQNARLAADFMRQLGEQADALKNATTESNHLRIKLDEEAAKNERSIERERMMLKEFTTAQADVARLTDQLKEQKQRSLEVIAKLEESKQKKEAQLSTARTVALESATQLGTVAGQCEILRAQVVSQELLINGFAKLPDAMSSESTPKVTKK